MLFSCKTSATKVPLESLWLGELVSGGRLTGTKKQPIIFCYPPKPVK